MTPSEPPDASAVYEFTIVGRLGPVLERALAPCVTASQELQTIFGTSLPDGDLVDLVLAVKSRGLEITGIWTSTPRRPPSRASFTCGAVRT